MTKNIDTTISQVNSLGYLISNSHAYMLCIMKFGERLKLARERKGLTQAALAELVGMAQPTIHHLESPKKNASGSEFTPRLARVLGVSVDWLADEIGDMIQQEEKEMDPRIAHVVKVMESLPPYAVDAGVREIDSLAELVSHMPRPNGATGAG